MLLRSHHRRRRHHHHLLLKYQNSVASQLALFILYYLHVLVCFFYPWAVYCEGPPSFIWSVGVMGEGQNNWGKKIEEHFPEASAWGIFVRRFRPEEFSSTWDFGLGRTGCFYCDTITQLDITIKIVFIFIHNFECIMYLKAMNHYQFIIPINC